MLKLTVLLVGVTLLAPVVALADQSSVVTQPACNYIKQTKDASQPDSGTLPGCGTGAPQLEAKGGLAAQIVNGFLYVTGTASLIFILVGGIRYITATGDATRIKAAKDTVLYAIIGLIVTALAFPISGFVIKAAGG